MASALRADVQEREGDSMDNGWLLTLKRATLSALDAATQICTGEELKLLKYVGPTLVQVKNSPAWIAAAFLTVSGMASNTETRAREQDCSCATLTFCSFLCFVCSICTDCERKPVEPVSTQSITSS